MKVIFVFLLSLSLNSYAEPIGSYDQGQLIDGECMPEEGEGYMQLYRDVNHIWATNQVITMITKTAAEMQAKYPNRDRLQVEELSAKNGGDIEGHSSHENGLDADIQYFKLDGVEHDPKKSSSYYAQPMVTGGKVDKNFDVERNWELMKTFHKHGNVQKIFMDQVLKNRLCSYAKSKNDYKSNIEVLRSIRHVENHQDHLHIRLHCPSGAKKCRPLPNPPAGSGCP